jgi:hypothetical protein
MLLVLVWTRKLGIILKGECNHRPLNSRAMIHVLPTVLAVHSGVVVFDIALVHLCLHAAE